MDNNAFLGSGLKFPLQTDPVTGKIAMVSHEQDIAEAIDIIIRTHRGERVMRSDFGSSVSRYLFAPAGHSMKESVAYDVREQLMLQEPRIRDISVTCEENSGITGALVFNISYTIRSTNNRYNRVYPFFSGEEDIL